MYLCELSFPAIYGSHWNQEQNEQNLEIPTAGYDRLTGTRPDLWP